MKADAVEPQRREAWVAEQVEKGLDVLICHPRLVQTGLDLIDFPTICWYETDYSVYTMRQASRRSSVSPMPRRRGVLRTECHHLPASEADCGSRYRCAGRTRWASPSSQRGVSPFVALRRKGHFIVGKPKLLRVLIRHAPVGRGDA